MFQNFISSPIGLLLPPAPALMGLSVALGAGLLIGAERERRKGSGPQRRAAGIRTFTISSLLGALAMLLGGTLLLALACAFVAGLMLLAYRRTHTDDPGVTTELALVVACLLGGLAVHAPDIAAGVAAAVALILASKDRLHQGLSRWLSERDLHDALVFCAIALIALPLAPDRFMGPFEALNPHALTLVVVWMMAVHSLGYVALRALGPKRGLPLAGFVGGFISSTATIHAMGVRCQERSASLSTAVAAAALSSVATVIQVGVLVALVAPSALPFLAWPLALSAVAAVLYAVFFYALARSTTPADSPPTLPERAFKLSSALGFALLLSAILLISAGLHDGLGTQALWPTAALTGLADAHAGALTALSLVSGQKILPAQAVWPVLISLLANTVSKTLVAYQSGGWPYAVRVVPGLLCLVGAACLGTLFN